ncbi:Flp pilus assembly protein CpaB [Geomonas terrae]|uniref:Flp pilus assembly protein CpaB n=1 Tax=Geomonas terrae TaxID=2562681 RepID=A0A4S1CB60_9BACT|nr:Flp pilus assembly protein CpaB [Geomonas terrae]TGU70166.1 Flp pilus assembly protein CpaB [Geomonas terrae]
MTRPSTVAVVSVFALLFAVAAAWLSYTYLQKEMATFKAVQPQRIVVAATDIPVGSTIKEAQLKVTSWPKDSIPPGSSREPEPLVNRVAVRPINGGDAVTEAKLKPRSGAPGSGFMTYVVPQGHRAVTVAVNEVAGVAGFLTPSDRVDVVVTMPLPENERDSISRIVLENAPVLATGQITDQKGGKPVVVPTVTLDLTPEESEKLVLSASKGSLQLLLRNISDSAPVASRGITVSRLLGVQAARTPQPVANRAPLARPKREAKPTPEASYTLVIVRGSEKSSRQYPE